MGVAVVSSFSQINLMSAAASTLHEPGAPFSINS